MCIVIIVRISLPPSGRLPCHSCLEEGRIKLLRALITDIYSIFLSLSLARLMDMSEKLESQQRRQQQREVKLKKIFFCESVSLSSERARSEQQSSKASTAKM
jgi:hypothetical protein